MAAESLLPILTILISFCDHSLMAQECVWIFGISCKAIPLWGNRGGFLTTEHDPVPFKKRHFSYVQRWLCSIVAQCSGPLQGRGWYPEDGKTQSCTCAALHWDSFSTCYLVASSQPFIMSIFIHTEKTQINSLRSTHNSPVPFNSC